MTDLVRDDITEDEARLIEMCERIFPKLTPIYVCIGLLMLASVPSYGWWILIPVSIDACKASIAQALASRGFHPHMVHAGDQYTSVIFIGIAIYFAGGATSPFFPFLAIYAVIFPVLFSRIHVRWGFAVLLATTVLAALGPEKAVEHELLLRTGTLICLMLVLAVFATELMRSDIQYRAASLVDELTGLPNRRAFDAELESITARIGERDGSAALVVGDIDHFKAINDAHGHDVGDDVLVAIAAELRAAFRSADVAYRIGGEEFAFVLSDVHPELASGMASSLCDRIAASAPAGHVVSMSFGVANKRGDESPGQWFRRADAALFAAKRAGRNRVEVATANADR